VTQLNGATSFQLPWSGNAPGWGDPILVILVALPRWRTSITFTRQRTWMGQPNLVTSITFPRWWTWMGQPHFNHLSHFYHLHKVFFWGQTSCWILTWKIWLWPIQRILHEKNGSNQLDFEKKINYQIFMISSKK
jgi:hypothetical protein